MDDGFQNPTLAKDLSLVVIDGGFGVGNGQVLPAGPLRERLAEGLSRADAIIFVGGEQEAALPDWLGGFARPVLYAQLAAVGKAPSGKLVAFAGLARPEKFFDTLAAIGADVDEAVPFVDHHPYSEDDLALLAQLANDRGAQLITTEKDAARLSPGWRRRVSVLPVTARFSDEAALDALLAPIRSRMKDAHG
jgi:tetraacyldisaccharide 4'-kinase